MLETKKWKTKVRTRSTSSRSPEDVEGEPPLDRTVEQLAVPQLDLRYTIVDNLYSSIDLQILYSNEFFAPIFFYTFYCTTHRSNSIPAACDT